MVALNKGRVGTLARSGDMRELPVKGGVHLFIGALAAVNAAGLVVPMTAALNLRGLGRVEADADNTNGADGAIRARVGAGIFRFGNSAAGDLITAADIGKDCFGVDDQTVAKTDGGGTRSIAGRIFDVDPAGVFVKFS